MVYGGILYREDMTEEPLSEEPKPKIDERIAELEALNKTREEITVTLYNEGYSTSEILKQKLPLRALKSEDKKPMEEEPSEAERFEERVKVLKKEGKTNKEMSLILEGEGFKPGLIIGQVGGAYAAAKKAQRRTGLTSDDDFQAAIQGRPGPKTLGYIDDLRAMVQHQISQSRELTEVFYNVGLGTLLGALSKSGLSMEDFRRIALKKEGLREALEKAGETAFKALEYYESDLITKVEAERDEARAYSTVLDTRVADMLKNLDPKIRLEKMIHTYLLSGGAEPDVLMKLIDKWLSQEIGEVRLEVLTA